MAIIISLLLLAIILMALHEGTKNRLPEKDAFLERDYTDCVKGIGIIVVFFNHIDGYLVNEVNLSCADNIFFYIIGLLTALFVAGFLFFSGYGVTESIKKKGQAYVKTIPNKRLLTTLLNFDIAVLLYVFAIIVTGGGNFLTVKQLLLSLVAWDSVGNSNWYIFCILCCYLFSFVSAKISEKREVQLFIVTGLFILYIVIISIVKESWWFNTILAYPCGVAFSYYKRNIKILIERSFIYVSLLSVFLFCVFFYLSTNNPYLFNITSVLFCILLAVISSKISLNSKSLKWSGDHLFQIYIYQRLPMIIISTLFPSLVISHHWLFVLACFTVTVLIASVMPRVSIKKS